MSDILMSPAVDLTPPVALRDDAEAKKLAEDTLKRIREWYANRKQQPKE